jgi:hypothetical protein
LVTYETSFTCCLMTTCVTGIFYILVQIVMMNLKHSLSSSLILALVTGKHVFFITAGDEQMINVEDYQISDCAALSEVARYG